MAMPANIMSVGEFIAWACSHGCTLEHGAQVGWHLGSTHGSVSPRYLVNGKRRPLAVPANDDQPLNFYAVWTFRARLGIAAEPSD